MNFGFRVFALFLSCLLVMGPLSVVSAEEKGDSLELLLQSRETSFGNSIERQRKRTPQVPLGSSPPSGFIPTTALTYQIHVLGEVTAPGTYRVNASTRLSEALQFAGGVAESGSERWIELRRVGYGGDRKIDYLSFEIFGNLEANPYLLDNDVIYVPLKKDVVRVEGAVKRPANYELRNEKTLDAIIRLAGGFAPGAWTSSLKVVRFREGTKEVIDVDGTDEGWKKIRVESADVVVVPHVLTEKKKFDYNVDKLPGDNPLFYPSYDARIFVLGGVEKPGPYSYNPYYDIRQYVTLAGGTTRLAKPGKIKLLTSKGKKVRADTETELNPGDTIIVPERYMAPENFVTLVLGVATSVVSIVAISLSLSR